jgi:hypothetical protein
MQRRYGSLSMVVPGQFVGLMRWRMQRLGVQRLKRCFVGRGVRRMGLVGGYEHVVVVGVLNSGIEFEIVDEEIVVIIAGTVVVESLPKVQVCFRQQKYVVMKRGDCEYYVLHCVHYSKWIHGVEAKGMRYELQLPMLEEQHSHFQVLHASQSRKIPS